ncbi:MAG: LON peptidase substrate-binding domain-containing protein [Acidimicrobiales bacterium]
MSDGPGGAPLPMFPLGTVLFPSATLPVHVFEPRYRALTAHCLAGDGHLGVVLIERGSEVGGGDTRVAVGTRARIADAVAIEGGRWVLVLVGVDRIRVTGWVAEEPFPQAEVADLADVRPGPGAAAGRDAVERVLRRALALRAELGEPTAAPATVSLAADPATAAWQAAAVAPLGPADAQRVLEAAGPDERLGVLESLLEDEVSVLAHLVAGR